MAKGEKKTMTLRSLRKHMEKVQDEKRFEHTLGVSFVAASLAMRYGVDVQKAQIAGMLHDCAKCLTHDERVAICKKNDIRITEVEYENPSLLHAKVGAFLAKEKYGIEDEEILSSIQYHTTGRPAMTTMEKIVFIADYIEPERKKLPNMAQIREMAFVDLDEALYLVLRDTLEYLGTLKGTVDPMTQETYQYYIGLKETKGGTQ